MTLTDPKDVTALLKKHNLFTKKFLGQNFLVDNEALESIVKAANISSEEEIIEIGPGLGVLTQQLAKRAKKVTSIELDKSLFPVLEETLAEFNNTEVIHQDALRFTPPSTPYKVVANIPYNITSPLINHFLQAENKPTSITFLVQKEVAEKVCKKEPDHTVLSLQVYLFGTPKIIANVKAESFLPPPKVDSAILHIDLENKMPTEEALQILNLAKRAFRQRRKKLSNTLPEYKEQLSKLELLSQRPQHLSIDQWQHLNKLVAPQK